MLKIPRVSYFNGNDVSIKLDKIIPKLTEINIIRTKNLDENTIKFLLERKDIVYLHLLVNGMGGSEFEPKIQPPKRLFENLKSLIDRGFPLGKILVLVEPIIPNYVGLQSMELLLKVMVYYKGLKIRQVQFQVLPYFRYDKNKINKTKMSTAMYIKRQQQLQEKLQTYGDNINQGFLMIANKNITKRSSFRKIKDYLNHMDNKQGQGSFFKYYKKILDTFRNFIYIDVITKQPIGIRELKAFGLKNTYIDDNRVGHKLIEYDEATKTIKNVNMLNGSNPVQCSNKCVLCPYK